MRDLLERIQRLLVIAEIDAAIQLCQAQLPASPGAHELGMAMIALFRGDAAKLHDHATRAVELGAGAYAYQYLAISHVLRGDAKAAIELAQKAVALDDTPVTRAALGTILLAASRPGDALSVLRQAVFEHPSNHEARLNLAAASAHIGDHAEAITHYARAFVANPGDRRPIEGLITMFADLGRWLGAMATVQLARTESAPPAEALVLDLAFVHVARLISASYPPPGVNPPADRAVEALARTSEAMGPAIRLEVAHTLVELGRLDAARRLVDAVAPTTDDERAAKLLVEGALAEATGDRPRAIDCYIGAQDAAAERTDAGARAIALLLAERSPEAQRRIAELLARIPEPRRAVDPELLLHEARYLVTTGERGEARGLAQRVVRMTGGAGPIAAHARRLLDTELAERGAYAS